jgi:hypothetical protein
MSFVKLKLDEVTEKLDLSDWNLDTLDKVEEFIRRGILRAAGEALHHTLVVDPGAYIEFKTNAEDPLTISFSIADLDAECSYPMMHFSLHDIWDSIDFQDKEGDDFKEYARRVAQALRLFADEVDPEEQR